ncbi:MAG: alpha-amylase family glycosyl hydrolase [Alloprevotella sp.]
MKKNVLLLLLFLAVLPIAAGTKPVVHQVHPLHWWAGMENPHLQILIHGEGIGSAEVSLTSTDIRVERVVRPTNTNYLILYVNTADAAPQRFDILLRQGKKQTRVPYELQQRGPHRRQSFSSADVVYLLMPDRFADGSAANNHVPGLREPDVCLQEPMGRHGGDLQGVIDHLDYLADLGITALWLTPTQINDMSQQTYHGYAITDYYQTDPRLGSNEDYRRMVSAAHDKGIKVLMDLVFNHCGVENFLYRDVPDSTWFNNGSRYRQTTYRIASLTDPNGSREDVSLSADGWFTPEMPDFNQRNPDVMAYLTQASVWWIEYADLDGIRQDTYPYIDFDAMAAWNQALERQYPGFNVVGETWINHNVGVSFWQKDSPLAAPRNSQLKTVMDFPLMYLLTSVVDEETNEWDKGLARLYEYLSQDGVYADTNHLLTFLTNHDVQRFAPNEAAAQNVTRYKQALTLLLTLRGIPQLYYGDEIGMAADKSRGDGNLRQNFPGGMPDEGGKNAFLAEERTPLQAELHDFTRRLLQWRKGNEAVATGRLTHFAIRGTTYVYARSCEGRTCTVFINGSSQPADVELAPYREVLPAPAATDIISGQRVGLTAEKLSLPARGILVLDFQTQ